MIMAQLKPLSLRNRNYYQTQINIIRVIYGADHSLGYPKEGL